MGTKTVQLKPSIVASSKVRAPKVKPKEKSWAGAIGHLIK